MRWILSARLFLPAFFTIVSISSPASGSDRTELLDGQVITNRIQGMDDAGNLLIAEQSEAISLTEVRQIERADSVTDPVTKSKTQVQLIDGSWLLASGVTCADDKMHVRWKYGMLELAIESVQAIRLQESLPEKRFLAAVARQNRNDDTLFVTIDDKLQEIKGYLESLTDDEMTFEWEGATHTVSRRQVHGFVLALLEDPPPVFGRCRIELTEGSIIYGTAPRLHEGQLTLQLLGESSTQLPWQLVRRMTFTSRRLAFCSDLEPTNVIQESIVSLERAWKRDRSVEGRPLTLKGRRYEKGIGTQSRSLLTFNADEAYDRFVATVGIDDETEGRGDCVFLVRGDGRELYRQRVQGQDDARLVRIDIRGVREITLVVEPGNGLDMGDHANWCDARLIRSADDQ